MTNIRQAIDDLIDAADILVSRRDHVTGDVALIPRTSISRLEIALEQAQKAMEADKPVIYLASPYSHPDPAVRELRYEIAGEVATRLLHSGHLVYSPIVHSHPLVLHGLSTGWEYWRDLDMAMLSRCQELLVLTISGWAESEGVQAEILAAKEMGMPIRYTWHGSRGRERHESD